MPQAAHHQVAAASRRWPGGTGFQSSRDCGTGSSCPQPWKAVHHPLAAASRRWISIISRSSPRFHGFAPVASHLSSSRPAHAGGRDGRPRPPTEVSPQTGPLPATAAGSADLSRQCQPPCFRFVSVSSKGLPISGGAKRRPTASACQPTATIYAAPGHSESDKKRVDYCGKHAYTTSHEAYQDHQQHQGGVRHGPVWPTAEGGPPRVRFDASRCGEETPSLKRVCFPS